MLSLDNTLVQEVTRTPPPPLSKSFTCAPSFSSNSTQPPLSPETNVDADIVREVPLHRNTWRTIWLNDQGNGTVQCFSRPHQLRSNSCWKVYGKALCCQIIHRGCLGSVPGMLVPPVSHPSSAHDARSWPNSVLTCDAVLPFWEANYHFHNKLGWHRIM